jgi:hypothetical protein
MPVNKAHREQTENHELGTRAAGHAVDQHVHADVDTGAYAVGCTKLRHPDEHDDAQFLRPAEVQRQQPVLQAGNRHPDR